VSERGVNSETLRKVTVPIMSNEECKKKKYKPNEITSNMVCAGYDQGKIDACQVRNKLPYIALANLTLPMI